jgi:hypothetical protein
LYIVCNIYLEAYQDFLPIFPFKLRKQHDQLENGLRGKPPLVPLH